MMRADKSITEARVLHLLVSGFPLNCLASLDGMMCYWSAGALLCKLQIKGGVWGGLPTLVIALQRHYHGSEVVRQSPW